MRNGGATLLVIAALLAVLYAVGIEKGAIDTGSENQAAAFAEFLLSGFGTDEIQDSLADDDIIVTPETADTSQTTTAPSTTTVPRTEEQTTATSAATTTTATTTTTTATTTSKTRTTTITTATKKPAAATTSATTKKPTTTSATTTAATTVAIVEQTTTTQTTGTTKPTYANAANVVNPDYESPYYIVVYAGNSQSVAIYTKDAGGCYSVLERCFTCSTGAPESPTRTGQYKIRAKYRWRLLQGDVYGQYSSSISSSYLFHSVPYNKKNETTLDMAEYDKLGTHASHGCIRLCVRDTKWIYDNCPIGTQVNIVNQSGPTGAGVPPLNYDAVYRGWDPTDPDSDNPYN